MTDYAQLAAVRFLPEMADASLAGKAALLQQLLETSVFAPDGLMYSMPLISGPREVRPVTAEDCERMAIAGEGYWRDPVLARALREEGYMMENSVYTAGLYLRAQVDRYRATGEAAALREARRAYDSLRLIYRLNAEAGNPGFLSKPYGHQATAWSSADQHLAAIAGWYAYYQIADSETQAEIAGMWVDLADFAREHDYQLCLGDLGGWRFADQRYAFYAVFELINALALWVSGEARFRKELARVAAGGRWKTGTELEAWREWGRRRILLNEQGIPAHFCLVAAEILLALAPELYGASPAEQRAAYERIVAEWWRFSLIGMDESYLYHYWKEVDPVTGEWWPTGYREWMIDPDGKQLLPQEKWMACLLSSESPYLYLMAYWRGRKQGGWE